jgi:hypothetical protein
MSAVPRPPGRATTRSGLPSSSIRWLRIGPAFRPSPVQSGADGATAGLDQSRFKGTRFKGGWTGSDERTSGEGDGRGEHSTDCSLLLAISVLKTAAAIRRRVCSKEEVAPDEPLQTRKWAGSFPGQFSPTEDLV